MQGIYTGGIPPYGFKVEGKKLVADENTAPVIRYVFDQYANGVSKKEIIDELNKRGILSHFGRALTLNSLQHALRNPKYIGKYIYDGQEVSGGCEALISEDVFNAVQNRLDAVKRAPAAGKAKQEYLLQGKAFCGNCGAPLVGESRRGRRGGLYHYYACAKKKKTHTCPKKNEKKTF